MKKCKDPQEEWKAESEIMITKQLEPGENMLISTLINLFDDEGNKHRCIFFLTSKFVYNILDSKIIQKLSAYSINAVTVSKMNNEFIIHVPDEYDCRYDHSEKEEIIENLNKLHRTLHNGLPIAMAFKDDVSLEKYMASQPKTRERNSTLDGSSAESIELDSPQPPEQTISVRDFTLLKVLGRGTYGKVMLVKRKETGNLYAFKAMKKVHIVETERLEHTKVEKMILKELKHPFLVNLEFCFQTTEKIFFVMQFMRGGDLFNHLKREKIFSESRVKFYIAQIALAVGHLHSYNILYRDMKPENVLMGEDGYIALADFGMAKILNSNTLANSFCGTPEYIAPEIIIGEGHGKEVDWWGLGILAYEMLTGIPPFYDTNHNFMFQSIQTSDVKFPAQLRISIEAKDFILKCLEKDPKLRIGTFEDIEEIKSHPWFKNVDWNALLDKKIPASFKPVFESAYSTEYFDEQFTKEEPINSFTNNVDLDIIQQFDQEFPSVVYTDSI